MVDLSLPADEVSPPSDWQGLVLPLQSAPSDRSLWELRSFLAASVRGGFPAGWRAGAVAFV